MEVGRARADFVPSLECGFRRSADLGRAEGDALIGRYVLIGLTFTDAEGNPQDRLSVMGSSNE